MTTAAGTPLSVAETQRLLLGTSAQGPLGLGTHLQMHGEVPEDVVRGHVDLLDWADAVDLRGRGGAHFPFGRKARALRVACQNGRGAVVIGNGSEGEPASRKDATLLFRSPHLVLDGLQLAADSVRASTVRLVVSDRAAQESVRHAIEERRRAGLAGARVQVIAAPGRFVAGESSAVTRLAANGRAHPVFTTKPAAMGGVDGRPTLVCNVETLAHLAVLARLGVARYSSMGTAVERGTTLLTVHRCDGRSEVVEVAFGTPLSDILHAGPLRGVLSGGYHGAWLDEKAAADACVSRTDLAARAASLGAGVLLALPQSACPIVESAPMVIRMAAASAGQCGPCVNGLPAIARVLSALAAGRASQPELDRLMRWCGLTTGRGACAHPDGVVRFVRSLLSVFADEVSDHLRGGCGQPCHGLFPLGELGR